MLRPAARLPVYLDRWPPPEPAKPQRWRVISIAEASPASGATWTPGTRIRSLFYYLGLLAQARAPRKRPLQLLAPAYASDLAGFSRRYFREFFERLPSGALLLLDNWQEAESAALNAVLAEAITQAPHGVNLMVISRQEPAAELSGLVAKRSLVGLARADLRFTLYEMRALCSMQHALPDDVIEQLHSSTDDWAAGLTLMLESMRRTGAVPMPLDAEVKGGVFDYFTSQIFERTTFAVPMTQFIDLLLQLTNLAQFPTGRDRPLSQVLLFFDDAVHHVADAAHPCNIGVAAQIHRLVVNHLAGGHVRYFDIEVENQVAHFLHPRNHDAIRRQGLAYFNFTAMAFVETVSHLDFGNEVACLHIVDDAVKIAFHELSA